jgi:hypothetical protein
MAIEQGNLLRGLSVWKAVGCAYNELVLRRGVSWAGLLLLVVLVHTLVAGETSTALRKLGKVVFRLCQKAFAPRAVFGGEVLLSAPTIC